jgi:hypothetical protein
MQTFHARRHTASGNPIDLRNRVKTGVLADLNAISNIGLMGAPVLVGKLLILTESFGHPSHQPRRLQGPNEGCSTRTGKVISRRKRGAVRQPRLGSNDTWFTATTAPGHTGDSSWFAAKLVPDVLTVVLSKFF